MNEPHEVFRWLPRKDRAEYVRLMRRTFAIQWRDFNRAVDISGRIALDRVIKDGDRLRERLGLPLR